MIPKVIYQTYYTKNLPSQILDINKKMMDVNPDYTYQFYDDLEMREFIVKNYDDETVYLFDRLNVGAAKADFWRYLILYKNGGIYIDLDSQIYGKLDDLITSDDEAIISREGHYGKFLQWCLMFSHSHPILKICIDKCKENIKNKKTNNIIDLTGPTVFSESINEYCSGINLDIWKTNDIDVNIKFRSLNLKLRIYSKDYDGFCKFKNESYLTIENFNIKNQKSRHWTDEKIIFK